MFQPFALEKTGASSTSDRNWRIFDDSTKSFTYTPVMASATATPAPGLATAVLYGPIALLDIPIVLDNNDGWTTATTITIPYSEAQNIPNTPVGFYTFQVFVPATGAVITTCYITTTSTISLLKFAGAYTNTTGGTITTAIQGWYFRN